MTREPLTDLVATIPKQTLWLSHDPKPLNAKLSSTKEFIRVKLLQQSEMPNEHETKRNEKSL